LTLVPPGGCFEIAPGFGWRNPFPYAVELRPYGELHFSIAVDESPTPLEQLRELLYRLDAGGLEAGLQERPPPTCDCCGQELA
jgi:hypothetical protein